MGREGPGQHHQADRGDPAGPRPPGDAAPFEIEAAPEVIEATAAALGLDPRQGLRQSYLELQAEREP